MCLMGGALCLPPVSNIVQPRDKFFTRLKITTRLECYDLHSALGVPSIFYLTHILLIWTCLFLLSLPWFCELSPHALTDFCNIWLPTCLWSGGWSTLDSWRNQVAWNILYHVGGNGPWIQKVHGVVEGGVGAPDGCCVDQVHIVRREIWNISGEPLLMNCASRCRGMQSSTRPKMQVVVDHSPTPLIPSHQAGSVLIPSCLYLVRHVCSPSMNQGREHHYGGGSKFCQ